jgi:hypothetical protein
MFQMMNWAMAIIGGSANIKVGTIFTKLFLPQGMGGKG